MTIPESIQIRSKRRQGVNLSYTKLIKVTPLLSDNSLPLVLQSIVEGINLGTWVASNQELIAKNLLKHGGILFRNFQVRDVAEFEKIIQTVSGDLLEYRDRSSPRSLIQGNIYTSTDYPANQTIFLHSENSYA
ncbi:MAG: TauD/TfdA family dioxygenase, partial [Nostoc sp.]